MTWVLASRDESKGTLVKISSGERCSTINLCAWACVSCHTSLSTTKQVLTFPAL